MHVRLSSSLGLPIVEQQEEKAVGNLSGVLINPDSGKIEGFYISVKKFVGTNEMFISYLDVLKWGTKIQIKDSDVIAPAEDRVRLASLLKDPRRVINQIVKTKSGKKLGVCKDIQFDTDKMQLTWIFPKRLFGWGIAVPATEIIEVTEKEILVKDMEVPKEQKEEVDALDKVKGIAESGFIKPG